MQFKKLNFKKHYFMPVDYGSAGRKSCNKSVKRETESFPIKFSIVIETNDQPI